MGMTDADLINCNIHTSRFLRSMADYIESPAPWYSAVGYS